MVGTLIHILLVVGLPPLLLGVFAKTKSVFAGRVGAPVLQPYYDLVKLWQKGSLFSDTTTWVFRAGPVVAVATAGLAALLVPLGSEAAPVSFMGTSSCLPTCSAWHGFSRRPRPWIPVPLSRGWGRPAKLLFLAWPSL